MSLPLAQMSFPEIYERALVGPLFRPFAEALVEETNLAAGDRVLDIACGTGIVARLARDRVGHSAKVVGIDLSPAMLGIARTVAPDIDWREGDAAAPPLHATERFDVIFCEQGLQFFQDKSAAMHNMRHALSENGLAAVGTWRPEREAPVILELRRIAEQHVGPIVDRRHSFGETGPLVTLLTEAGFRDVQCKTVTRTVRFDDGSLFVRLNAMALIGMSTRSKEITDADREQTAAAITRDSAGVIASHTDSAGFSFDLSSNVATARVLEVS